MTTALLGALAESDRLIGSEINELAAKSPQVFIDSPIITPRPITRLMIVCGNCAGDDRLPRKTLLAADGSCATCGGNSYILASKFFLELQRRKEDEHI